MSLPPEGWFADPNDSQQLRWWDGARWTDHTYESSALSATTAPPQGSPVAVPNASPTARRRRFPIWAWLLIALGAVLATVFLSPVVAVVAVVVLITAVVSLVRNSRTWLRFRNRRFAMGAIAASAVVVVASGSLTGVLVSQAADRPTAAVVTPQATAEPAATPSATVLSETIDDISAQPFTGSLATVTDATTTSGRTALAVLDALAVKGRAPKTGYSRDQFGQAWLDVDRNGCDSRNDALARDLVSTTKAGPCKVLSGTLNDPYTATMVDFRRGQGTSELVQIDHVVSLGNAWETGAQQLTADQRTTFANDPVNLLAVSGAANTQKGEGDAATWLPKNKAFRCEYVARQVSVKATYGLWVTQAEHDAIARVLAGCPTQAAVTSTYAPVPVAVVPPSAPAPEQPVAQDPAPADPVPAPANPQPAPAQPAPAPPANTYYANCTAVRAAGAAPLYVGQPGYSRKLDRDGDGVACET